MDHATPISIKTHSCDPVPFTIAGSGIEPDGMESFDEAVAKEGGYGLVEAREFVGMMNGGRSTIFRQLDLAMANVQSDFA